MRFPLLFSFFSNHRLRLEKKRERVVKRNNNYVLEKEIKRSKTTTREKKNPRKENHYNKFQNRMTAKLQPFRNNSIFHLFFSIILNLLSSLIAPSLFSSFFSECFVLFHLVKFTTPSHLLNKQALYGTQQVYLWDPLLFNYQIAIHILKSSLYFFFFYSIDPSLF